MRLSEEKSIIWKDVEVLQSRNNRQHYALVSQKNKHVLSSEHLSKQ